MTTAVPDTPIDEAYRQESSAASTDHGSVSTGAERQIRGSSLLVVGRLLSVVIACVTQIIAVRYLSKANYGSFEYALAIVAVCETVITFGLDRAIARFLPIYHETDDRGKLVGTVVLGVGGVLLLGGAVVAAYLGAHSGLVGSVITDKAAAALLLILIFLAPIQALDNLFTGMFAVLAGPRAIFYRKHLLGPGLRLATVIVLVAGHCSLFFLAAGYLISGAVGVLLYLAVLYGALKKQGWLTGVDIRTIQLPVREVFAFTLTILSGDLALALMAATNTVLLGYHHDPASVASFRVVLPVARLNQIVLMSFGLLFTPAAARLFARADWQELNRSYWDTGVWMAVLSFPVFALTFACAGPLTSLLYGERYSDSALILAILSLGYYVNAAFGPNGSTLLAYGKTGYLVLTNVLVVVVNAALAAILIPRFGAAGAAASIAATLIAANLLRQFGLKMCAGMRLYDWRYTRVYFTIAVAGALLFVPVTMHQSPAVAIAFAVTASASVIGLSRFSLNVEQTFPELMRLPLMRKVFVTRGNANVAGTARSREVPAESEYGEGCRVVDLDMHGLMSVRLINPSARDEAGVARQIGFMLRRQYDDMSAAVSRRRREPGLVIRFVDKLPVSEPIRYLDLGGAAFTQSDFLILPGKYRGTSRAKISFAKIGFGCEIVCETGIAEVPLLTPILHLILLSIGVVALHASAFTYRGRGVLATGWAKGGKTETLLSFMARGAAFIGDEWIYIDVDTGIAYGAERPFGVWGWCLDSLPFYRSRLPVRQRLRLRSLAVVGEILSHFARAGKKGGGRKIARKVIAIAEKQRRVNLEPKGVFGSDSCRYRGRIGHVLLVGSHSSEEITIRPVRPTEVIRRMVFSLQYERRELMEYYTKFRFAFPSMRNSLIENCTDIEREMLWRALNDKPSHALDHPYPVPIPALYDVAAELIHSDDAWHE